MDAFIDFVLYFIDFALHIERYLPDLFAEYGNRILIVLFLIIFLETGLVVTPFLPGDSLLFLTGTLTAVSGVSLPVVMLVLFAAAVIGDSVNYKTGRILGSAVLKSKWRRFINQTALDKTHGYFEKYGAITVVIARFIPLVRTFAPFVAGISRMTYSVFLLFNIIGAAIWIGVLIPAGYFLGRFEIVKTNLSLVTLGIIIVSVLPIVFGVLRACLKR